MRELQDCGSSNSFFSPRRYISRCRNSCVTNSHLCSSVAVYVKARCVVMDDSVLRQCVLSSFVTIAVYVPVLPFRAEQMYERYDL